MRRLLRWLAVVVFLPATWGVLVAARDPAAAKTTTLRFEVTVAKGLLPAPRDGRLLLVLAGKKEPEPRTTIGQMGMRVPPVLGCDVKAMAPGVKAVIDRRAAIFPLRELADLPAGRYFAQAVFDHNRDLKLPAAPGNLYSDPVEVNLDPAAGGTVKLELTRQVPLQDVPAEEGLVKYVKIRSERLSKFHGRPIYLRAGVVLPAGYDRETDRRYPLRVRILGYGGRFTTAKAFLTPGTEFHKTWMADDTPRMILLVLDGAGPFGDPYQVNSANNGPYGDAITQELIPYVEKRFRAVGKPYARVLDGGSTGGWVSLALQVFYPDFFNGAWSHCPDPVDFRALQLINIYRDENAYVNTGGFERPAARELSGDVRWTVRHECQLERVLAPGDRWTLSGKDWAAWNAVFGPRGLDGLPKPIWDGRTGKIDKTVLDHWQKYDLRLVLERNWPTLAPKLRGKLHVWVGEADEYFLNNAVRLLDAFLSKAKPAYGGKVTFGPGQGHNWRGLTEKAMLTEMAVAVERDRREGEAKR
jgi:hypothetical protein